MQALVEATNYLYLCPVLLFHLLFNDVDDVDRGIL